MEKFKMNKSHAMDNIHFAKHNFEQDYVKMINDIIESKPFGDNKFYIFSFWKRIDDASGIKKMYHQPRLTKPEPVPGATLLRIDPNSPGDMTIVWTLPNQENFHLYSAGKMFADPVVHQSILDYLHNPDKMCLPEKDDLSDEEIHEFYKSKYRRTHNK